MSSVSPPIWTEPSVFLVITAAPSIFKPSSTTSISFVSEPIWTEPLSIPNEVGFSNIVIPLLSTVTSLQVFVFHLYAWYLVPPPCIIISPVVELIYDVPALHVLLSNTFVVKSVLLPSAVLTPYILLPIDGSPE